MIQASDVSIGQRLTATANVVIDVRDVQDQTPIFLGAPYSATLQENTLPVSILCSILLSLNTSICLYFSLHFIINLYTSKLNCVDLLNLYFTHKQSLPR